jgi:hypothetical protein
MKSDVEEPCDRHCINYAFLSPLKLKIAYFYVACILIIVTGLHRTKYPINCSHFYYCASPSEYCHSWFMHHSSLVAVETPNSKTGRNSEKWPLNFSYQYLYHTSRDLYNITCRNFLRHRADGFTFPPKQVMLRIFIAFKNPSSSAGFVPQTLGPMVSTPLDSRERPWPV